MEYIIDSLWEGKSIKEYLFSFLRLSRAQVVLLKKKERGILLNGERRFVTFLLHEKDRLFLDLEDDACNENIVLWDVPLEILHEDEDLICINKPAGMPTHPSMHHYSDTLANALASYYAKKGIPFIFRAVNRLDKDTSGIVLVAKNKHTSAQLSEQIFNRKVDKRYIAVLDGELATETGTIQKNIVRANDSMMLRRTDEFSGEYALTTYKVLARSNGLTIVEAIPHTGRTHQLRVHFASIGHPISGDSLYGGSDRGLSRQALHAIRLNFLHPRNLKEFSVRAPLPEDFRLFLEENRFEEIFD